MPFEVLTEKAIQRRRHWIDEIAKISGKFGDDSAKVDRELAAELKQDGVSALLDHLHLCGSIPEHYGHDSSEEKLYSKRSPASRPSAVESSEDSFNTIAPALRFEAAAFALFR